MKVPILLAAFLLSAAAQDTVAQDTVAPKPLFRDPIHDGAADPVIVWNRAEKRWFMLYTNRRANMKELPGVSWVHGTRIGIAESLDNGTTWKYRGIAKIDYGEDDYSHWAPDVVDDGQRYHMFLSVVPGTYNDWNADRYIVHLTSANLLDWKFESKLPLSSDRVIDATVFRLPSGQWRLWYKDERDQSHIHFADSPDLHRWKPAGTAIADRGGEGAKVFHWKGRYWMITDVWKGLAVYHSADATNWSPQAEPILAQAGTAPTDRAKGQHADVVVNGDRAYLFYFVHQEGADADPSDPTWRRRTVLQVAEIDYRDGKLSCDRNQPARVRLIPPAPQSSGPPE